MKAFFDKTVSAVKVEGELTDWFEVKLGTGQGDIQGPPVFNVCGAGGVLQEDLQVYALREELEPGGQGCHCG